MLVIERIAKYPLRAWTAVIWLALAAAWLAGSAYRARLEQGRLALLNIDVQRDAIAAMSLTLDSNLMGVISLLGLIEPDIKKESTEAIPSNQPKISALLENVGRSQQIQGLFVVGKDGFVKSSWDDSGQASTGIDVRFRPYYQQAMAGRNNIYAAVSLARSDHALYFAAPVYAGLARSGDPVGVVVARTDMEKLERLLARSGQAAVLLSPQGVVFASSRREWRGMLAGPVSAARVAEIRAVRQFGKLFEGQAPRPLPVSLAPGMAQGEGRRYAVASAAVDWHDPSGSWQLLVLEDLGLSVPPGSGVPAAAMAASVVFLLGAAGLRAVRSQAAQQRAHLELERVAHEQELRAERKMQLAQVALQMQQASQRHARLAVFLDQCHQLFGAMQGVIYTADADGLALAASYASTAPPPRLALGEGLLGQCALQREARIVDTAGAGAAWSIRSGLGEARAGALLLAPVQLRGRLLGAVELALLQAPDAASYEQFLSALDLLAINLTE
ncbi:GAF domain-containing protein [Duganella sp. CF458]|uniref:cache domain-containing protein n=1 Tax=Duganella sp. CF458 TaxID=1884368 RepID=UPI0008E7721B|nr:cache domain-containing protein [Duganella sp. CF458]SFF76147.1 GAF domain-containing protein [Duganella sp. CF458]